MQKKVRARSRNFFNFNGQMMQSNIYYTKIYAIDYTNTMLDYTIKKLLWVRNIEIETSAR